MKAVFNDETKTMVLEPTDQAEKNKMLEFFPDGYLTKSKVVSVRRKVDPYGTPINDSFMIIKGATKNDVPEEAADE